MQILSMQLIVRRITAHSSTGGLLIDDNMTFFNFSKRKEIFRFENYSDMPSQSDITYLLINNNLTVIY